SAKQKVSPKKSVPAQQKSRQILQHPARHQKPSFKSNHQDKTCYYCGKIGHIKALCYSLYGFPRRFAQQRYNPGRKWKSKNGEISHIAHTSLKVSSKEDWYFDSGCSKHMT
ncbi:gag-protease polyprotein, partial [Trifolium medium]|nr:gag-protease polyprotein [Trifolium medium]